MNQKDKLLLNEGFLFFAFGSAVNGYCMAACIFAVLALFTAIKSHSIVLLKKKGIPLAVLSALELAMIDISHLDHVIPVIGLVSFASLVTGILWMYSSEKAVGQIMKGMTFLMLVFLGLAFSLNHLFYGTKYTCLIVALLFLPMVLGYRWKEVQYASKKKHRNSRNNIPAVE